MRIVIVEDEKLIREGLAEMIRRHTDHVLVGECKNGREGIGVIEASHPDLVITDIRMNDMDGLEMLTFLHQKLRLFCNLLPLLQQFLFYPLQGLLQHINGNWFQQIFLYAQTHCLPGIFKLRIAADNDTAYLFPFLVEKSQHFQPIHIIHAYICNH